MSNSSKNTPTLYRLRPGFTLLEIMTVITIILIVAGMIVGASALVGDIGEKKAATGEMHILAQSLENYKGKTSDYPWNVNDNIDDDETLTLALLGKIKPNGKPIESDSFPPLIDEASFTIKKIDGRDLILDPWGNPYIYLYNRPMNPDGSGGKWESADFILISRGKDGEINLTGIGKDGKIDYDQHIAHPINEDNLIHGHED